MLAILNEENHWKLFFWQKKCKGFIFPSEKWQHQQHFGIMQWFCLDFQSRVITE